MSAMPAAGYKSASETKIAKGMFDAIAGRYDLLNTVLSGGLDRYWRRRAIASLQLTGRERLLDVCTGTADVAIGAARKPAAPHACWASIFPERCSRMDSTRSASGAGRADQPGAWRRHEPARGQRICGRRHHCLRHSQRAAAGRACHELLRVLRPGGRMAILEFGTPTSRLFGPIYHWYSRHVLPRDRARRVAPRRGLYLPPRIHRGLSLRR